jgi:ATP-dependent Clp protease ATP-binding subunit ClpA
MDDLKIHSQPRPNGSRSVHAISAAPLRSLRQAAVIHVQSSGREDATGANVLVAIFAERESPAAYSLQEQGMTHYDAINYISDGHHKGRRRYRGLADTKIEALIFLPGRPRPTRAAHKVGGLAGALRTCRSCYRHSRS